MILFVNACVRKESRTKRIADSLLQRLSGPVKELILSETDFPVTDEAFLKHRDELIAGSDFGDPMFNLARQFSEADKIVIAAPFWDLSFPASLKQYFEQINVTGITFYYTDEGNGSLLRYDCRGELFPGGVWLWICKVAGTGLLRDTECPAYQGFGPGYCRRGYGKNSTGYDQLDRRLSECYLSLLKRN